MIKIYFVLMCLFLVSCDANVLQIVSTGEKVKLSARPYVVGDTVILCKSSTSDYWKMDVNWTFLNDTIICSKYDSVTYCSFYREAVIIQ